MIRYFVALIVNGQFKSGVGLHDTNIEGLKRQIKKHYPDYDEHRLEGHGFHYITNASHYSAAGFDDECFVKGYDTLRAPAHFNAPFFYILRATQTIEVKHETQASEESKEDQGREQPPTEHG